MVHLVDAIKLYLVVDPEHCEGGLLETTRAAIRGGVTAIQLRSKLGTDREIFSCATTLQAICADVGVPFIVNDRLDIALAVGADGVHLGADDLPIEAARDVVGQDFIIGFSPETEDQLRTARERGADYLGIGPVFTTTTKGDAGMALGLAEFHRRVVAGGLPSVGIGGITHENAGQVIEAGADGIAVVSAILRARDPEAASRQLSRNSKSSSTRRSSLGSQ